MQNRASGGFSRPQAAQTLTRTRLGPSHRKRAAEETQHADCVRATAGTDAHHKEVTLTAKAPASAAGWRPNGGPPRAAFAEIQIEIPYPLGQVATDIEQALQRKSFHDRTAVNWPAGPTWNEGPP